MDKIKIQTVYQKISELTSDHLELDPNIFINCIPSFNGSNPIEFLEYLSNTVFSNLDKFLLDNESLLGKELANRLWELHKYPSGGTHRDYKTQYVVSSNIKLKVF